MVYALERADFLQALEDGLIDLPAAKRKQNGKARGGKFICSANCCEIDVVAGRNRLKILDWRNYGFDALEGLTSLTPAMHIEAWTFLRDYLQMCQSLGVRVNKSTSAQLGWQHCRIDHAPPVLLFNYDQESREMERRAYFGGRNEPYRLGEIPDAVFSLDVKSSYASICLACPVPIYQEASYRNGLAVEDVQGDDNTHWIADVLLSTPEPDYPLRFGEQLLFPIGQFQTALCWPELQHALSRGRVDKVLRAARYRASPALRDYAEWYLAGRERLANSDHPEMALAIKALFNGSLGYTARQKYTLVPWRMDIDRKWWIGYTSAPDGSAPIVHAQVLNGQKEWLKVSGEPREAMPFLHATITSWARLKLLAIMQAAGREWIHYCDTDGILVDYRGFARLADHGGWVGSMPGQLSERFPSGPCKIQGQKNYRIGDNVICAGMVRTRRDTWEQKNVLTTPTGRVGADGVVYPFEFRLEETGDENRPYINMLR